MNSAMPPVLSRRQTPHLLGVCILTLAGLVVHHSAAAEAHDPNWGAQLHAEHCAGCHTAPHDAAFYESRQGKKSRAWRACTPWSKAAPIILISLGLKKKTKP
ncbi:MAG: hypothetical protein B7Y53_07100 [Halothiobacillus sp. 28-55-5]|nr:MAG: hypothetical protein B7Y53_07100 [Halothiobacillus sp. 28-55-5]